MKLTHDKVRAALQALDESRGCSCDACADDDPLSAARPALEALCEEWLARNAARWDEEEPETLRCNEWFGHVRRSRHGLGYAWFAFSPDDESGPRTEAAAREWLEAKAREAGYEVAK